MVYVTYEAVRQGIPTTEVCDAKVWHKLDDTHEVMSNTCKFVVESVDEQAEPIVYSHTTTTITRALTLVHVSSRSQPIKSTRFPR